MQINTLSSISGLLSAKRLAKQEEQKKAEGLRHNTNQQAPAKPEEDSHLDVLMRFVQAPDEIFAAAAQLRNRRDYEKRQASAENFERVLDEEVVPKADRLVKVARRHDISAEELLRRARTLFPDDSDLILVLRELVRRRGLEKVQRQQLRELLQDVESKTDKKQFNAGINSALKARLFGKKLAITPGLLRASYRQFLESEEKEAEIYLEWITCYGHQKREGVLNFVEQALLSDISAQDPSCSHSEFGALLVRLSQIKLLRSADSLFIGKILANLLICKFNRQEDDWLWFFFALLFEPLPVRELLEVTLGEAALAEPVSEYSTLVQSVYRISKLLPPQIYIDELQAESRREEFLELTSELYRDEQISISE